MLSEDSAFGDKVASGDVIMIATGPNEGDRAFGPIRRLPLWKDFVRSAPGALLLRNFDAILDEIDSLRGDRPRAIRLVSAANFFVSDPNATDGFPPDTMEFGGRFVEALNTAEGDAAGTYHAICVEFRPVLKGPTLDQPVDENSPRVDAGSRRCTPRVGRWPESERTITVAVRLHPHSLKPTEHRHHSHTPPWRGDEEP